MSNLKYPRGSEWRKWDLQVHTPFSALNNGFGDDFDRYAKRLFEKAVEKGIAVIGITDYFSIEGYKLLRALVGDGARLEKLVGSKLAASAREIRLLPNIELRTSVIITRPNRADSRVNFHVIFSDDVPPDVIDEHFFRELKFTFESGPGESDQRRSVTVANLESLGSRLKKEQEERRLSFDVSLECLTSEMQPHFDSIVWSGGPRSFAAKCSNGGARESKSTSLRHRVPISRDTPPE